LSRSRRRLIGRHGINLFSVAQLAQHFLVITKTKGSDFRSVAEISLGNKSEQQPGTEFDVGKAKPLTVRASDKESHGTEIILLELWEQTRDQLASLERWERLDAAEGLDGMATVTPPRYHIGCVSKDNKDVLIIEPRLPWTARDKPLERFRKLMQAMVALGETESDPSLDDTFDNYLQLIWTLSLAVPLKGVEKHPYDVSALDGLESLELSNENKGQAKDDCLKGDETPQSPLHFKAPNRSAPLRFEVFVDGIQLGRPIRF